MRAFLAIELPEEARCALVALQRELDRSVSDWRWTRPEALHLTLRFLGKIDDRTDRETRGGWAAAARSVASFALVARGLGCFPDARRPRVLWIGVEEPDGQGRLSTLAEAVERTARMAGFSPEPRRFEPHLSLARAARTGRPRAPRSSEEGIDTPIPVTQVVLFESQLEPTGARYTARARFPLGDAPGTS